MEIVKRALDAYNRRDIDSVVELCTPDCEHVPAIVGPVEGVPFRGREGLEALFALIGEGWEELRIEAEEFRDLGGRAVVAGRVEGRGRSSGVPVDSPLGSIVDLRGDRIPRVRSDLDQGEALRATGLSE